MNIKGLGSSNLINLYAKNSTKVKETEKVNKVADRIEISSVGKKLNSFNLDGVEKIEKKDLQKLRESINNGTYNVDASLTAKSILDAIKENK